MQLNINDDQHLETPDVETVRSAIANLLADQFIVLSVDDDHYVQVFHHDDGSYQLEYRDGSADDHFGTDPDDTTMDCVLGAFQAYLQQADNWQSAWNWEKIGLSGENDDELRGFPETFPIRQDDYHAKHIGRTADGNQFFLTTPFVAANDEEPGCEFIALFLFDQNGNLIETKIDNLGPRATMDRNEAGRLFNERLASLGRVEFCHIQVAPFQLHRFDTIFGLIPREPEDEDDERYIELHPGNYMAFYPPWDGYYDT